MSVSVTSKSRHNDALTNAQTAVPYPLYTFVLANVAATDQVRVWLRSSTEESTAEYDDAVVASSFANNGGKLQFTLSGATMANYSATAGAHSAYGDANNTSRSVFINFTDVLAPQWATITSINVETVTVDIDWPGSTPSDCNTHLPLAGDVDNFQGSTSGVLTGNLLLDALNEDDLTEGYQLFLYREDTNSTVNDTFQVMVSVRDASGVSKLAGGENTALSFGTTSSDTIDIRNALSVNITTFDDQTVPSTFRVYPDNLSARGSGAWTGDSHKTVLKLAIQDGQAPYSTFVRQRSDGIEDDLGWDQPYDAGNGTADTWQVYFKSSADTPASRSGQENILTVVVTDAHGRVFQQNVTIALLPNPTFTITENGAGEKIGDHTDGNAAFDEVEGADIPVLEVKLANGVPDGAVGTYSISGNSSLGVNSTFTVNVADNGGAAQVTFTSYASQTQQTTGPTKYFAVGDHVYLGAEYGQGTVASIDSASQMTLSMSYDGGNDNTAITLRANNVAAGHTYVTLLDSVDISSGPQSVTIASGNLVYTENGVAFNVFAEASQAAITVWKFAALTASDFTLTLDTPSSGAYLSASSVLSVERATAAAATMSLQWTATKGLGLVNQSSTAVAMDAATNEPAGTTRTDEGAILAVASSTAVDAATGATGITLQLDEHATQTFARFFDFADGALDAAVADGNTAFMDMSFTVTVSNPLSAAAASLGTVAVTSGDSTLRVYDTFSAPDSFQTVFHIDYADTGGVFQNGTVLLNNLSKGGGFTDYSQTTITSAEVDASANLQRDDTNDDIELTASALSAPTQDLAVSYTIDDALASGDSNTVTGSDFSVYFWAEPVTSFDVASPVSGVPVTDNTGTVVDTTEWIQYTFNTANGHTQIATGAVRQIKTFDLQYASSTTLTCTVNASSVTGYDGGTVFLKDAHANYNSASDANGQLFTASVSGTTVTLTVASGTLTDHSGAALSGYLELRDATLYRQPFTVTIGTSGGDDSKQALFDWRLLDNGGSSALYLRCVSSDPSDYAGTTVVVRLAEPAFDVSAAGFIDRTGGSVGSQGELWAAQATDLSITFSAVSWDLGTLSSAILTNFGTGTAEGDTSYDYTDQNSAQTHLLNRAVALSGINASTDPFKIFVLQVATDATPWASVDYSAVKAVTYATVDEEAVDSDGVFFVVNGGQNLDNSVTSVGDEFTSGDTLRLQLVPSGATSVRDGDKFVIGLVTSSGSTLSGGEIAERFLRRVEVRYSGGVTDFTLAKVDGFSYPGATSFDVTSVTVYNSGGTQLSTTFSDHTWDYTIEAAAIAASGVTPPATTDATADAWRFLVASGSNASAATIQTAMRRLPDVAVVTADDDIESSLDRTLYNTTGLNFNTANSRIMRFCYRLSLRRYDETAGTFAVGDDDVVSKAICASTRTSSMASSVTTWGTTETYGREAWCDDKIHLVRVGMSRVGPWTDTGNSPINSGNFYAYAFDREVQRWKMVEDDNVVSGSG